MLYFLISFFNGRRKKGNVFLNKALNTFDLQLYGFEHMVKDHLNSEKKPAASTSRAILPD